MQIVDPPSGWRYGFPKPYNPKPGQTYEDWLRENNYPNSLIPLALEASRWSQQPEMEST